MASSIPMAIVHWANNLTVNTANGSQKTISDYKAMVAAMKRGLSSQVNTLKSNTLTDAQSKHYVTKDSPEAKIMVTDNLKNALHKDIAAIIGSCTGADSAIDGDTSQSSLAPDIINAYKNQVIAQASQAQQTAESQKRTQYEAQARQKAQTENQALYEEAYQVSGQYDQSILTQNLDRYINAHDENNQAAAAGNAAYQQVIANADIAGKSSRIKSTVQADILANPPRTIYVINDSATGCGIDDNSTALAIGCYSVHEGNDNNANPDDFEKQIQAGASKFFTTSSSSVTNPQTHQTTVTYSITYVNNGAQKMFNLTDEQYEQSAQMALNMLTLIQHLEGKGSSADNMVEINQVTGGTGSSGGTANLQGNVSGLPVSNNLVAFIESWEGFSAVAYNGEELNGITPSTQVGQTIGYGHVIQDGENFTLLTMPQAQQLLITDLQTGGYMQSVQREFSGMTLTQSQFDALVSLAYNCGPNDWGKWSLTNDIKNHASAEILKTDFEAICHIHSAESEGLLRRRDAEWAMFTQGVYQLN